MRVQKFADAAAKQRAYRVRKKEQKSESKAIALPKEPAELLPLETLGDRIRRVAHLETSEDKLLGDLIVTYGLNILYADKGVGKTKFLMHLMIQWAKEPVREFAGFSNVCGFQGHEKIQKILFCDYELGDLDYRRRKNLLEENEMIEICIRPTLNEILQRGYRDQYNIIVIDNISFLIDNLNSATEVKRVLTPLKTLSETCTIILLGHVPFEKRKLFGSKYFEIIASSLIEMYKYNDFYCFRQEKGRDLTIYGKNDAIVLNSTFEYQSVLNTKILEWGNLNILYNSFLSIKKELANTKDDYLEVKKTYHLTLKEIETIKGLGEILYCKQQDYQFLMKENVLSEPENQAKPPF